jgi:hypothetical protein
MNTEDRVEMLKEYFDKLLYTDGPKELIKTGRREINEFELVLNIVLFIYLFFFCFLFFQ